MAPGGRLDFFGTQWLSDYEVLLGNSSTSIPVHGIIMAQASQVLRALVEISTEGSPPSPGSRRRRICLPTHPGDEGAVLLVLRAMYDPLSLTEFGAHTELLVGVLRAADKLQADSVLAAAAQVLAGSAHSSNWRWSTTAAVLELPNHLLTIPLVRPLHRRALDHVLEELGELEAAWSDPHARGRFLALPIDVMEHMLGDARLKACNENTVVVAVSDYVERGRGRAATPRQLSSLLSLLRFQHCTPTFFVSHVLTRPWVATAMAAAQTQLGGSHGTVQSTRAENLVQPPPTGAALVTPVSDQVTPFSGTLSVPTSGSSDSLLTAGTTEDASSSSSSSGSHQAARVAPLPDASTLPSVTIPPLSPLPLAVVTEPRAAVAATQSAPPGAPPSGARLPPTLALCAQWALAISGTLDAAAASGVLGHPDGLPASLADPPRDPTASLPPALLSLEVPLQRLRAEADILRGSLTPHPSTATSSSAQHQRSVSSPNLMPSPTVVWGGYVWALDVFICRDPELVLGASLHALCPAFGLPATPPPPPPTPGPDVMAALMSHSSPRRPDATPRATTDASNSRAATTVSPFAGVAPHQVLGRNAGLLRSSSTLHHYGSGHAQGSGAAMSAVAAAGAGGVGGSPLAPRVALPRVRTGRTPLARHLTNLSALRSPQGAAGHSSYGIAPTGPVAGVGVGVGVGVGPLMGGGMPASQSSHTAALPPSYTRSQSLPASAASPGPTLLHSSSAHPSMPPAAVAAAGATAPPAAPLSDHHPPGEAAYPPPPPPPPPAHGGSRWAVSAEMRLEIWDHDVEAWTEVFQHTLHTNTGLELVPEPPVATASTTSATAPGPPSGSSTGSSSDSGSSKSGSVTADSSRGKPSSLPAHLPRYSTIFTDYYTVLTSSGLMRVLDDPLSWQRQAYAPDGRLRLRARVLRVK